MPRCVRRPTIAPTLMGILMTLKGKRLAGFALTALFVGLSVHANHLQITYYQFLLILVLMITEAVFAFREKRIKPFVVSGLILIAAAGVGIGPNFGNLWSTYTYTKETMRGGSSELSAKKESKGGLQFDYAMMWSYSGAEHLNLIIPMYTGGWDGRRLFRYGNLFHPGITFQKTAHGRCPSS